MEMNGSLRHDYSDRQTVLWGKADRTAASDIHKGLLLWIAGFVLEEFPILLISVVKPSRRLCLLVYKVHVVDGQTSLVIGLNGRNKWSPTMLYQIVSTDYRTLHRFEIMTFGSSWNKRWHFCSSYILRKGIHWNLEVVFHQKPSHVIPRVLSIFSKLCKRECKLLINEGMFSLRVGGREARPLTLTYLPIP